MQFGTLPDSSYISNQPHLAINMISNEKHLTVSWQDRRKAHFFPCHGTSLSWSTNTLSIALEATPSAVPLVAS
jgi:hypothetical protein